METKTAFILDTTFFLSPWEIRNLKPNNIGDVKVVVNPDTLTVSFEILTKKDKNYLRLILSKPIFLVIKSKKTYIPKLVEAISAYFSQINMENEMILDLQKKISRYLYLLDFANLIKERIYDIANEVITDLVPLLKNIRNPSLRTCIIDKIKTCVIKEIVSRILSEPIYEDEIKLMAEHFNFSIDEIKDIITETINTKMLESYIEKSLRDKIMELTNTD